AAVDEYAFVFVDCPPSLGPLTVNALAAAERVLVPVQAEYYALEGLAQLVRSVELVRSRLNPRLAVSGVLLTMVDRRTRLAADVADEVRRHFGPLVFRASVPRSVRVAEAPSHGLPVTAYDRRSSCDRARPAATSWSRADAAGALRAGPAFRPCRPSYVRRTTATRSCSAWSRTSRASSFRPSRRRAPLRS